MTEEALNIEIEETDNSLSEEATLTEETELPQEIPQSDDAVNGEIGDGEIGSDDVEALKNEISELRRQLDERQSYFDRMSREIGEFSSLFPERALSDIPDQVWNEVRSGIPLAASYALYEKKLDVSREKAERVNSKNKESSTGAIGRTTVEGFFTPDEVRAMSREEIKKHYPKIIESMKKWN